MPWQAFNSKAHAHHEHPFSLFSSQERFHSHSIPLHFCPFLPFDSAPHSVYIPCIDCVFKHRLLQNKLLIDFLYPRVKVRGEEEEEGSVATQEDRNSLLLKVFESLSLQDRRSPGNEHRDNSPPHARIPKSYVPITPMPSVAVSKGTVRPPKGKNNKEIDVDSKTNIRASSVPRPRAVLSSPDNDGMIGSRNKLSRERHSVLKTRNSGHDTLAHGKTILTKDSPSGNTRRVSKEADSKPHPKEKHATEQTVQQQKVHLRKAKPSTAGI